MEYLDDESDDLFRRAGENYPLKTTDSDWDKVLGRLQSRSDAGQAGGSESGGNKNRNRRLLWLLLLIPFTLIGLEYFSGNGKKINPPATAVASDRPADQPGHPANAVPEKSATDAGAVARENKNNRAVEQQMKPGHDHWNATAPALLSDKPGSIADDQSTVKETSPENQAQSALPGQALTDDHASDSKKVADSTQRKATATQDTAAIPPAKKTRPSTTKEKGIYLSLLGGPDLSTVKFQSVKNIGYSVGLLVGFRFNKHLSLETGVFWDKKQYYSDGEYFDKSKTNIPASVEIKDIDGNCNMFEIPIAARYDFGFNRKGRFFATGGLTSYLMKKENYVYTAAGYAPGWSHAVSYENSGNNLFSIVQLSAGYEYKLGKTALIRIEPYFSIPLSGVGIGSLDISSAGLHLGITVPLKK